MSLHPPLTLSTNCTVPRTHPYPHPTIHVFLPALFIFLVLYHLLAPLYATPRQRSWILTALSSAFMTTSSIPFVRAYLGTGLDVICIGGERLNLAYVASRVFQAYLVADQIAGATYYKDHIFLLTGWIHHNVYILIVECAIRRSWTDVFSLCTIMELPTFILSICSLHPSIRPTLKPVFTGVFFITRIVLHLLFIRAYLEQRARDLLGWIPGIIIAIIWPLHAYWFWGSLRGLRSGSSSSATNADDPVVEDQVLD